MRRQQQGFTMVELIVVIIILGVLAAVALPRMTSLQGDARTAKLNAVRGSVASAMTMVNGSAMVRQGQPAVACPGGTGNAIINAAGTGTVCATGGRLNVTFLYPAANLNGVVAAAGLLPGGINPTAALLQAQGYNAVIAGNTVTFQVTGGSNAANCSFVYTAPTAAGVAPTLSTPVVTGCL